MANHTPKSTKNDASGGVFESSKNLLIAALVIVTAIQAFMLFRQQEDPEFMHNESVQVTPTQEPVEPTPTQSETMAPTPSATPTPGKDAVSVAAVTVEADYRRYILVAFDRPLGQDLVGKEITAAPAKLDPDVQGTWSWISPFLLRFDAVRPLAPGANYYLSIKPKNILNATQKLKGEQYFTLETGHFSVKKFKIKEAPFHEGKARVTLNGEIEFTYSVDPRTLVKNITCVDPLTGKEKTIPINISTTYKSRWIHFTTAPVQKTTTARELTFLVKKDLVTASGELTLGQDYTHQHKIFLDPVLRVSRVVADSSEGRSSLKISFSTPLRAESSTKYISVTPKTPFSIVAQGYELTLSGDFKPGADYSVTIGEGLTAADGAVLKKEWSTHIVVPDLTPSVDFRDPGMFLSKSGFQTLALKTVNSDAVDLKIDRVYKNNIFGLLQYYSSYALLQDRGYEGRINHFLGDRLVEKKINIAADYNTVKLTPLDLKTYIPENEYGFFRVYAGRPNEWRGAQRWALVTDLGVTAKKGEDEVLVNVSSFKDLSAVAGATVSLISDQNQTIAKGHTDEQGLWHKKDLAQTFQKHQPFMILVEKDNDLSFLLFDSFKIDTTGQDVSGEVVKKTGYTAFLYGERDIYRPGETAKGVAVIRDARLGVPASMPLRLRQRDPQGRELGTTVLKSDARGMVEFSLPIESFALTGEYALELLAAEDVVGRYSYKVEEFIPDRIKVEIKSEEEEYTAGDELSFSVLSRYFFGPPAAGMDVEARVRLEAAPFAPTGYKAYTFGLPERKFQDKEILTKEDSLDDNGEISLSAEIPKDLKPPAALNAVLSARVRERGGRGVTAKQKLRVHAYSRYPGLKRLQRDGVTPNKPVSMDYVVISPDGKPVEAAELQVDFYKERWQTVLRRTPSGGYDYKSVKDSHLISSQLLKNAGSKGSFDVTPPKYGGYRVVLTDPQTGAGCEYGFYASGWGYSPWAVENPGKIELALDKEEYMPGDIARVQVRAPFPGKLLISVDGESVHGLQVLELQGQDNTAEVLVPIQEEYSPNAYVSAILVRKADDLDHGAVARASGFAPLFVNRTANKIQVKVMAPEEVKPETELTVNVHTTPNAALTVAIVDEGILQLIAQKTPDPFAHFYAKRALGVDSYDIFSMLFPEVSPHTNLSPAGGGLSKEGQFVRTESLRRVKPVSFWSGVLTADENGAVEHKVKLPDFQGAVRVMAVSANEKQFGASSSVTRIKGPLTITPTFPRFLAPEEKTMIPVTLRNDSGKDGEFTVVLDVQGAAEVSEMNQNVFITNGKEQTVYFTLKTGAAEGRVTVAAKASGNDETVDTDVELFVRAAYPFTTQSKGGMVQDRITALPLDGVDALRPESLRREVRIGRLPLVRFSGGLKRLLGYPYGCVEQTTSRVFPLLYFNELAQELEPELFEQNTPAGMVQSGISRLMAMQMHSGGFSMWPGGSEEHPWGSVYATHFLLEAKQAGFRISESALKAALKYLAKKIKGQETYSPFELERLCYSLYVLAKGGKPDLGVMSFLRSHHEKNLTAESGAFLAAAYALTGDRDALETILHDGLAEYNGPRETGRNFDSVIRNLAMRLATLIDVAPNDARIPTWLERLTREMEGVGYMTTQEDCFSFLAMGKFFAKQQAKAPYSGRVFLGDELVGAFTSDTTFTKIDLRGDAPLRVEMDEGFDPGSAFYNVNIRGIPTRQGYTPESKGLNIESSYLDRKGAPLDLSAVKQGDLVVLRTKVKSSIGPVQNVVVQSLLPTGLEVENPRLESTEKLPWIDKKLTPPAYQDLRDDRVLLFLDLPQKKERAFYSLLRAVTPGVFTLPPARGEAMYNPELIASGPAGEMRVLTDEQAREAEAATTPAPASPPNEKNEENKDSPETAKE